MDLVLTLAEKVASREGTRPTALPPLYETVDPDALAAVVDSAPAETTAVRFDYCGYTVTVDGTGDVDLVERDRAVA